MSQIQFLNRQTLYLHPDPARVIVRPFKPATEPRAEFPLPGVGEKEGAGPFSGEAWPNLSSPGAGTRQQVSGEEAGGP